jgi:hypothetical protein
VLIDGLFDGQPIRKLTTARAALARGTRTLLQAAAVEEAARKLSIAAVTSG